MSVAFLALWEVSRGGFGYGAKELRNTVERGWRLQYDVGRLKLEGDAPV